MSFVPEDIGTSGLVHAFALTSTEIINEPFSMARSGLVATSDALGCLSSPPARLIALGYRWERTLNYVETLDTAWEVNKTMASCGWFPLRHDEILAWVEEHRDGLPTTLAELSIFPVPFRRVIVNYVGHEQRTKFWQEHLRTFLELSAGLTADQRVFVEETILLLPGIFASPVEEAQGKMRPLEERMKQLFERPQCAAMFGMVGPPEPPEGLPLPPGTRLTPAE